MVEENEAYARWDRVSDLEEKFLKHKSKLHWLQVGDKNTKAFHRAAATREAQNTIREILSNDGTVKVKKEEIKAEAERFFREFLQLIPNDYEGITITDLQQLLPFRCSAVDQQSLIRTVTDEEIKKVLFSMPNDKAPGPDGYTSEFYKAAWEIIGKEFTLAIQSFFTKGFLPKGINSTILALIPKKTEAREMRDYRPISCCNVIYKVISKIIANRLKTVLPKFVAGNQSAFVKDRLLIENLLLATELVKDYHKDSISSRCAIKIDISKAFDSVQWCFIRNVLTALNFPQEFIHWITLCITTASFSVQVNGELAGYFQSSRGLRQGCALSPYLFVISMDVLSKMLDKAAGAQKFGYHPRCKSMGLTHLSFADDLMVLSDGKVRSLEGIVEVFDEFAKRSGLKISMEKSTVYLAGQSDITHLNIANRFPFSIGQLPVRYLGLPLVTKRLSSTDCLPLLEQIRKRITSWTSRFLSYAGRLNLISSVLWSICNFWLAAFRLPRNCIRELDKMCSAFLWSGTEMCSTKAKISWDIVCKPKEEGGLGLRSLKEANDVCCLKLVWRIVSHSKSLWVTWLEKNVLKNASFWVIKQTASLGSWIWKKLLKYREVAKSLCKVEVGNGELTSFWYDSWSPLGRLIEVTGERGLIDMGIGRRMNLVEAWTHHRRRRHRTECLNQIEDALAAARNKRTAAEDKVMWKRQTDVFNANFSTKETWHCIRTLTSKVPWYKGVWFTHSTPKYSFCTWLVAHGRLSTGDRMLKWKAGVSSVDCIFCQHPIETRDHLFFSCVYSSEIWAALAKGVFKQRYTSDWGLLLDYISTAQPNRVEQYLQRYVFQVVVYTLWRERNCRRHGEQPNSAAQLIAWTDKQIRNQLSSIRQAGDRRYEEGLQLWFKSRS
ncbi:Reverse transcriptase zinc-binding domain [Arabidopsis suecica]|uniref:Reverse transcriptase zinc-binding domain n=1 Tax=Arabidopsis suecica TaxID=45249 RepID=A0A8T1ZVL5_ARASU|nr:Reverse transcriptase zinc-binding domain [Arabidopsis suecica]